MPRKITEDQRSTLIEAWARTGLVTEAAKAAGMSRPTAEKYLKAGGYATAKQVQRLTQILEEHSKLRVCYDCGSHNVGLSPTGSSDT